MTYAEHIETITCPVETWSCTGLSWNEGRKLADRSIREQRGGRWEIAMIELYGRPCRRCARMQ